METKVILREKFGKVWGEVIEKITDSNSWREMFIYRSWKDKDDNWQKSGWGDRDVADADKAYEKCKALLTGKAAEKKVDLSKGRVEIDNSDVDY